MWGADKKWTVRIWGVMQWNVYIYRWGDEFWAEVSWTDLLRNEMFIVKGCEQRWGEKKSQEMKCL